jgi:hypothetical protein
MTRFFFAEDYRESHVAGQGKRATIYDGKLSIDNQQDL